MSIETPSANQEQGESVPQNESPAPPGRPELKKSVRATELEGSWKEEETAVELEAVYERLGISPRLIPRRDELEYFKDENARVERAAQEARRQQQENVVEMMAWYEKAQQKAQEAIIRIDPNLKVSIENVEVTFEEDSEPIANIALSFSHEKDSSIRWTMSIEASEDYLENRLEPVIRRIYEDQTGTVVENRDQQEGGDDRFGNQQFEQLEGREREKRQDELAMIDLVNEATNKLREHLGLQGIDVPDRAIHLIAKDKWEGGGSASFVEELNAILIKSPERLQIFKKKLIHETLHLKSPNILPRFLNEALIETLTKRMMQSIGNDALTMLERKESDELFKRYPDHRAENGDYLFTEDTFLAYTDENGNLHSENFTYKKERGVLDHLIDRVHERGKFKSREEVFTKFVKASFSGERTNFDFIDEALGQGAVERMLRGDAKELEELVQQSRI